MTDEHPSKKTCGVVFLLDPAFSPLWNLFLFWTAVACYIRVICTCTEL